jgi:hypothetical protein
LNVDDIRRNPEESTAPRRPKPSIKFLTDVEPVVVEANVNKRGLLRAPTPYPKELRALAKHASHIRQSKEQNGEVNNTVRSLWSKFFIYGSCTFLYLFRMNRNMREIIQR